MQTSDMSQIHNDVKTENITIRNKDIQTAEDEILKVCVNKNIFCYVKQRKFV